MNNEQVNEQQVNGSVKTSSYWIGDMLIEMSNLVKSEFPLVCDDCRLDAVMTLIELECETQRVRAMLFGLEDEENEN